MLLVFDPLKAKHVVVDGYIPSLGTTAAEKATSENIAMQSLLLLIQVISQPIMFQEGRLRSPYNIWQHFPRIYFKDSSISFVNEIYAFHSLSSSFSPSRSMSKFLD